MVVWPVAAQCGVDVANAPDEFDALPLLLDAKDVEAETEMV